MGESQHDVEIGEAVAGPASSASPEKGDLQGALEELNRRVETLCDGALEKHERVTKLEAELHNLQAAAQTRDPEAVAEKMRRLSRLEESERTWSRERHAILKTVEDLIHKVDALEKQL
ncbi:MAG: hypothetical protein GF355_08985 [Candidatus Eisenbacteria bacterium]|nr:hypothetical protein [Candidatus Eisenbacteria bacterium]